MDVDRLAALIERVDRELGTIGEPLKSVLTDPPDGDAVREAYGELVDRNRGDATVLATLKAIGEEIRKLEADGVLPSAMVARSDRRKR